MDSAVKNAICGVKMVFGAFNNGLSSEIGGSTSYTSIPAADSFP